MSHSIVSYEIGSDCARRNPFMIFFNMKDYPRRRMNECFIWLYIIMARVISYEVAVFSEF